MQTLQIAEWAKSDSEGNLNIDTGARPIPMANSDGTGHPLLSKNGFGADIIRFEAGRGWP